MTARDARRRSRTSTARRARTGSGTCPSLEDGRIATHPTESLRGDEVAPLTDVNGYHFGPDLLAATEDGAWVTYVFRNRESGRDERKHSWVVRHDGLLFVSGWYERDY